jgi:TetR/AcrR family transcriptional regulator, transcriptional repressor for nem operon
MGSTHPETRERLVEAAIALIFTRGYGNVGVQELCERAAVKKGSFYHFFASKRDLTLVALDQHWRTYRAGIEACVTAPMTPFQRVEYLFERLHAQYQALDGTGVPLTGCAFGTLSMEVSAHDTVLRSALERVFLDWSALFTRVFEDAMVDGDLPPEFDASVAGAALLAYLEGVLLMVKTMQNPALLWQLRPSEAQFRAFGST